MFLPWRVLIVFFFSRTVGYVCIFVCLFVCVFLLFIVSLEGMSLKSVGVRGWVRPGLDRWCVVMCTSATHASMQCRDEELSVNRVFIVPLGVGVSSPALLCYLPRREGDESGACLSDFHVCSLYVRPYFPCPMSVLLKSAV